jgi:mono/diheme cytochrome c family protein
MPAASAAAAAPVAQAAARTRRTSRSRIEGVGISDHLAPRMVKARQRRRVQQDRHTHGHALLAGGLLALVAVLAQGYLGGRMTYDQGVGVYAGGQFAQTADGARRLGVALAKGTAPAAAGRQGFARSGLGCASCHGDQAQGLRGPSVAGGAELTQFRHVHGAGLFPPRVVTDRDFQAINAWLGTLRPTGRGRD